MKANDLENDFTQECGQKKVKNEILMRTNEGGNAGQYVIDNAKDKSVDLVVMGSRGLGTVRRTFLGSVSDYVVHHSKIPVLICPK